MYSVHELDRPQFFPCPHYISQTCQRSQDCEAFAKNRRIILVVNVTNTRNHKSNVSRLTTSWWRFYFSAPTRRVDDEGFLVLFLYVYYQMVAAKTKSMFHGKISVVIKLISFSTVSNKTGKSWSQSAQCPRRSAHGGGWLAILPQHG